MKIGNFKGIVTVTAEVGAYITNGVVYTDSAYLGKNAGPSDWRDATAEEYAEWEAKQENPEDDEATAEDYEAALSELGVTVDEED